MNQPHSGQKRVPYVRRCLLHGRDRVIEGLVCNIGVFGAYINVDPIPEVGERVQVSFPLPGTTAPVELDAEVTWQNPEQRHKVHSLPPGCGIHFVSLEPAHQVRIKALVDAYTPPTSGP